MQNAKVTIQHGRDGLIVNTMKLEFDLGALVDAIDTSLAWYEDERDARVFLIDAEDGIRRADDATPDEIANHVVAGGSVIISWEQHHITVSLRKGAK